MTDFVISPRAATAADPVTETRSRLSRLLRRARSAAPVEPCSPASAPPVVPVPSASSAAVGIGTTPSLADSVCSWPGFRAGSGLETLRWMDTPHGPCLVGRFVPPAPRER